MPANSLGNIISGEFFAVAVRSTDLSFLLSKSFCKASPVVVPLKYSPIISLTILLFFSKERLLAGIEVLILTVTSSNNSWKAVLPLIL